MLNDIRLDRNTDKSLLIEDEKRMGEYQAYLDLSGRWWYNDDGTVKYEKFDEPLRTQLKDAKQM